MQTNPLLEQLDWFFTSPNWTLNFPMTEVLPLAKLTSDHIPCKIAISTKILRFNIFRFKNFWVEHEGFLEIVQNSWASTSNFNPARNISVKLKRLRANLKAWSRNLSNLNLLIGNCNAVIGHLDSLEELRLLYSPELNLRLILKRQLRTLLRYKNAYWKKRFTNNKVKFGDECTKFFHAMATISYRRNAIPQLLNENGAWIQDHDGKAGLLWNAFRNRLGVPSDTIMLFDLTSFIQPRASLEELVEPFLPEEIDLIVKRMPTDKAPGPDGFNGLFLKKCWPIVKQDFYSLCESFFHNDINLEGINTSFIVLVPKKNNP